MTDYTLSASAGSYAETGDDAAFLARTLGTETRVFNVTGVAAGSSTSLLTQTYPAFNQSQGTKRTMRAGTVMRFPTNGDVRARRGAPFAARDPTIVHKNLSLAQWQELRGFEAIVRGRDSFPVFYVGEGVTVPCIFAQNPFDARISPNTRPVRFNVTTTLVQVQDDVPPYFFLDNFGGTVGDNIGNPRIPDIGEWSDQRINFGDGSWDNVSDSPPAPWPRSDLLLDGAGALYVPTAAAERYYDVKFTSSPSPDYAVNLTFNTDFSNNWGGDFLLAQRCSNDPTITPDGGNCIGTYVFGNGNGSFALYSFVSDTGGLSQPLLWSSPVYDPGLRTTVIRVELRGLTRKCFVNGALVSTDTIDNSNGSFTAAGDNYFGWWEYPNDPPIITVDQLYGQVLT